MTPGADFETAAPVALFDAPLRQHATTQYDVTNDGRFLINRRVEFEPAPPVTVEAEVRGPGEAHERH